MSDLSGLDKICLICDDVKPSRTHHCSVCNQCVFLMDHHCPWINNCVGVENRRYFLLFNLYLLVGCVFMLITYESIKHTFVFQDQKGIFSFLYWLDYALTAVMVVFAGWNWYMALNGTNTIEYSKAWKRKKDETVARYDFRFEKVSDNLFGIFGTNKVLRVLSPSMRNVPFTGIEWAFLMQDLGFS